MLIDSQFMEGQVLCAEHLNLNKDGTYEMIKTLTEYLGVNFNKGKSVDDDKK